MSFLMATTAALLAFLSCSISSATCSRATCSAYFCSLDIQRRVDRQPLAPDKVGIISRIKLLLDLVQHIERKVGRGQNVKAFGHRLAQSQLLRKGRFGLGLA